MYDVIVAGGGPAGCAAAERCAGHGLSTLLVEEHASIGNPVQCAGLLSLSAFDECGVSGRSVLNTVSGARIFCDSECELAFDAGRPMAHVVDRAVLDREMAHRAAHAGAGIMLKTSVTGFRDGEVITRGIDGRARIGCRLLIAADGPRSTVARSLGFAPSQVYLAGIQADLASDQDPRSVGLYPLATDDFFGWSIPTGPGRARVGLCTRTGARERFEAFISGFHTGCIQLVTGVIPLGPMARTYGHRTLVVGDAAGFAKPTSGGGIYTGVRSARYAADTAIACCKAGRFDDASLAVYERRWQEDFGRELAYGMRLFRLRSRLTPAQVTSLCMALQDERAIRAIISCGDIDRPSMLVRRLAREPAVIRALGALVISELTKFIK